MKPWRAPASQVDKTELDGTTTWLRIRQFHVFVNLVLPQYSPVTFPTVVFFSLSVLHLLQLGKLLRFTRVPKTKATLPRCFFGASRAWLLSCRPQALSCGLSIMVPFD